MFNIETETLEYWQDLKAEYEQSLAEALDMENPDNILIGVIKDNIQHCIREINVRN